MAQDRKQYLTLPTGTEGFSFEDAYRHRSAVRLAEDIFGSWGYLPAQLPVVDFFDSYRTLLSDEALRSVYRLIDREGELLMLRSDITLFLAKHLGAHAGKATGPVRICYSDAILRYQDSEDISHNEFYQLGAELIGVPGLRGDVEIAALLGEVVEKLGVPEPVLHIGSRTLFDAATSHLNSEEKAVAVSKTIDREFDDLGRLTGNDATPFAFIGSLDEFESERPLRALAESVSADTLTACESSLTGMVRILNESGTPFDIRIDLSEIGAQSYYTGVVFGAYVDGAATAIASGGRYDDLLCHFGDERPAVGFSLMLRKIMQLIAGNPLFEPPAPVRVDDLEPVKALETARSIREAGGIAQL